jgi:hypothetical protein
VLAVIAADTDDLRRLDRRQERRLGEWDAVHAAAGKVLDVAIVRRLEEQASDFVPPGDRLDQAIVGRTALFEPAISHRG